MKNFSLTYTGVIIMVLAYIAKEAGVPLAEGSLETTISTLIAIAGAIVTLIGRWRKGDLTIFGKRK